MPIRANFYLTIDPQSYDTVSARLGQVGLTIDSRGLEDPDTKDLDRSHIMIFQQEYRNADSIAILERMTQLYGIDGVRCIQPLYIREDEPEIRPRKRGYLIGLGLGTVLNLVNVILVINQVKPSASMTEYVLGGVIPTIVGAANTIYTKFFSD